MMTESVPEQTGRDLPFFYVNAMHLSASPFDFTMDFAFNPSGHHHGQMHPTVRIAMSPSHAKSMLKVLADRVAMYEEEHGVIPSPHYTDTPES
jgi:hypothetical protein